MKIGLQIIDFAWQGAPTTIAPILSSIARRAEDAGFDSLWAMDHFFQVLRLGNLTDPILEAYTALAFVAAQTSRLELGVMVTSVTHRHPGVLLKTITTLDVLSGGRAWLGLGTGWYEQEHLGLGIPFPPLKERYERLEETLQVAHLMWSGETTAYHGTHYTLTETLNSPPALTRPHPPILIGGSGETKTLPLVARYADACNFFASAGEESLRRKLEILKAHCETLGRSYASISKTTIGDPSAMRTPSNTLDPDKVIAHASHLADLGFDYFHLSIPNVSDPHVFDIFQQEIVPAIHAL
jgi:F420-dependent oxidoreductase-like protein